MRYRELKEEAVMLEDWFWLIVTLHLCIGLSQITYYTVDEWKGGRIDWDGRLIGYILTMLLMVCSYGPFYKDVANTVNRCLRAIGLALTSKRAPTKA